MRILITSLTPLLKATGLFLAVPAFCHAAEMEVQLFGQPCRLVGPFDMATLKAVHAVSPAQAYPNDIYSAPTASLARQVKESLERVKAASPLPPQLDPYREKLQKRLQAIAAFDEGYLLAQKSKSAAPLLEKTRAYTSQRDPKAFEALARKLMAAPSADHAEKLMTDYLDRIEADPEDEFHRTTRKLQIRYTCAFEEKEDVAP